MLRFAKTMMALGAISLAVVWMPGKAEANPGWVVPALIIGGVALVAISAAHANRYYAPARPVYVRPRVATRCHIVRERTSNGGYRRVQVCG